MPLRTGIQDGIPPQSFLGKLREAKLPISNYKIEDGFHSLRVQFRRVFEGVQCLQKKGGIVVGQREKTGPQIVESAGIAARWRRSRARDLDKLLPVPRGQVNQPLQA